MERMEAGVDGPRLCSSASISRAHARAFVPERVPDTLIV
jgi:hypothetical protein